MMNPLRHGYEVSENAFLQPILNQCQNVLIDGLRIIANRDVINGTNLDPGFRFNYCSNVRLISPRVDHFSAFGASFRSCWNTHVEKGRFYRSRATTTGYGVGVFGCSENFYISGDFISCRHSVSIAAGVSPDGERRGVVRKGTILNSRGSGSEFALDSAGDQIPTSGGDAFDCHSNSEDITFVNLTVTGASGSGFNYEGRNPTLINCNVNGSRGHGFFITNRTTKGSVVRVSGRVVGWGNEQTTDGSTRFSAMRIINGFAAGRGAISELYLDLKFSEGGPRGVNALQIQQENGMPRIERGKITVNGRATPGFEFRALDITGVDGAQIEGDVDVTPSTAATGPDIMQIDDCSRIRFNFGGLASRIGIEMNNVTDSTGMFALVGSGANDGINLDPNCTGNIFFGSITGFANTVNGGGAGNTFNGA